MCQASDASAMAQSARGSGLSMDRRSFSAALGLAVPAGLLSMPSPAEAKKQEAAADGYWALHSGPFTPKELEGFTTTDNGLQYKIIQAGTGVKPVANSKVYPPPAHLSDMLWNLLGPYADHGPLAKGQGPLCRVSARRRQEVRRKLRQGQGVWLQGGLNFFSCTNPDAHSLGVSRLDRKALRTCSLFAPLPPKTCPGSILISYLFTQVGAGQVIKAWDQAFLDMKVGEKRIIIAPPELA